MRRTIVAVACLALLPAFGACSSDNEPEDDPAADRERASANEGKPDPHGPLPEAGAARCVEEYSPAAVAGRGFAFDGVVVEIGSAVTDRGDTSDLGLAGVTFEVRDWFVGGTGRTVTVDMPPPLEGQGASSEGGPSYAVGSRLLVGGQPRWGGASLKDPIAWGCGFSRYHDAATANAWENASR